MGFLSLWGLDPETYEPHDLHAGERLFPETNCYVDLWIEFLHAQGLEPTAMLAFCTVVDFEGDQWTFFKPPLQDLERLYGIDVYELAIYRPMPAHLREQMSQGRTLIVEVDGYYLPDVAGRSYRETHEKTSVAVEALDDAGGRLRYFHGQGYHELTGDDYANVMRVGREFSPDVLPPYVELVRLDRLVRRDTAALRVEAEAILRDHLARRPAANPVTRFGERLARDLPGLLDGDAEEYHLYAFATVRQCGSAFECAASFLRWLTDDPHAATAADAYATLASESKTLLFKLARRRPFDPTAAIERMAEAWEDAISHLLAREP